MTKKIGDGWLSINQSAFCKYLIEERGNARSAYSKAYTKANENSARKAASKLLKNPHIQERINEIMEENWFNSTFVDLELMGIIKQSDNLWLKLKAIIEYNKITARAKKVKVSDEEFSKENKLSIEKELDDMTPEEVDQELYELRERRKILMEENRDK